MKPSKNGLFPSPKNTAPREITKQKLMRLSPIRKSNAILIVPTSIKSALGRRFKNKTKDAGHLLIETLNVEALNRDQSLHSFTPKKRLFRLNNLIQSYCRIALQQSQPLMCSCLVSVDYPLKLMTIPFGEYQPPDEKASQLFTYRLRQWLDERLRQLASQQRIQDARALRAEFSIEERSTR